MASGDVLVAGNSFGQSIVLLDAIAATGTNDGVWIDCGPYLTGYVTITGVTATAIVEVDVSNASTRPANNTHGLTHTALSAGTNGAVTVTVLPRWLKARISTLGTGTVTAIIQMRR